MKRIILFVAFIVPLIVPAKSFAFNPNFILSDDELRDSLALGRDQIQHFLNRGFLGDYETEDASGITRSATDIIWQTAQNVGINPKFILVLIQKEQSLVEDPDPTEKQLDWAAGYAVCDDCSTTDESIQRWSGFGKQVNSASLQFIEGYMADIENDGVTQGTYGPDISVEIDGEVVTPANAATASMYAYTPHLHGNENFVNIWNRWFSTLYPTGTLLQVPGESGVWLIEYGYKRPIRSMSALVSRFNPDLIVDVTESQLDNYADGRPIDFPNYSLLKDEDGNIYLLVDDALRHIDSMETFRQVGFNMDEVVDILNADLSGFDAGEPITIETLYPQGNLLQIQGTEAVFFIQDGSRHMILDPAIMTARFPGQLPQQVLPVVIEQFTEGKPLLLPDGVLVKSPEEPTVYVVSEGEKRAIPTEDIFVAYGWSWTDILTVSASALRQHTTGADIEAPSYLEITNE